MFEVIYAPSLTGKTHFIVDNPDKPLVDHDMVVAVGPGWPQGNWWSDKSTSSKVIATAYTAMKEHAATHPGSIYLTGVGTLEEALSHLRGAASLRVVIPTASDLARHFELRRKKEPGRPSPSLREVMDVLAPMAKLAEELGCKRYHSLKEAVEGIYNAD